MIKIADFQLQRAEIIQSDRYLAACAEQRIPYYKVDHLFTGGTWRGRPVTKPDFADISVLVTGHSDYPLDAGRFSLARPQLRRWFSTNVAHSDPRLVGIPLGITNSTHETPLHPIIGNLAPLVDCAARPRVEQNLVYMNFSPGTYPQERQAVWALFAGRPFVTAEQDDKSVEGHRRFLQQVASHRFVLCPRGNGVDTHRVWEALYLKSIPIVRRSQAMSFFDDLPILFVDRWEEALDAGLLARAYDELHHRHWNMDKLNVSYWEREFRLWS